MTVILETRIDHEGNPYQVFTPAARTHDHTFNKWFTEQLREFLFRQGINVNHISDETLTLQVRNTFGNTKRRFGSVLGQTNALQSEEPTTPKEGTV